MVRGDVVGREGDLAVSRAAQECHRPVDLPLGVGALAVQEANQHRRAAGHGAARRHQGVQVRNARAGQQRPAEREAQAADGHGVGGRQPRHGLLEAVHQQPGAAPGVGDQHPPADGLEAGVAQAHVGVGQGDFARRVAADQRARQIDLALGDDDLVRAHHAQVDGAAQAAGFGERIEVARHVAPRSGAKPAQPPGRCASLASSSTETTHGRRRARDFRPRPNRARAGRLRRRADRPGAKWGCRTGGPPRH